MNRSIAARALQRLARAFAALDEMDSAHEVAISIQPKGLRIATLSRLAVTAAAIGDPCADALFSEARTLTGEMRDAGFQEIAQANTPDSRGQLSPFAPRSP